MSEILRSRRTLPQDDMRKWFIVQVARATKGKADPNVTKELVVRGLDEKRK